MVERLGRTPVTAGFRLARLIQDVRTHHFADALETSDELIDELRPLGVEAGYGMALMALCYHQHHRRQAEHTDTDTDAASAGTGGAPDTAGPSDAVARWWQRATLLLPAPVLVDRFPELKVLT